MTKYHGYSGSKIYKIWMAIKDRCTNKNNKAYKNYGGRGIKICSEWKNPATFCEWAFANGYKQGLSIDRVNNDGNYEPSNCRWATKVVQELNKRINPKNTSGQKGVHWDRERNKWFAQIKLNQKAIALGRFSSLSEAIEVRKAAELEYRGFVNNVR